MISWKKYVRGNFVLEMVSNRRAENRKVTVNIFTKGERVGMQKDISAYPPRPESFNKKPKDWKNAMTMAEMGLKNND